MGRGAGLSLGGGLGREDSFIYAGSAAEVVPYNYKIADKRQAAGMGAESFSDLTSLYGAGAGLDTPMGSQ